MCSLIEPVHATGTRNRDSFSNIQEPCTALRDHMRRRWLLCAGRNEPPACSPGVRCGVRTRYFCSRSIEIEFMQ
jgi:hypothetical protein